MNSFVGLNSCFGVSRKLMESQAWIMKSLMKQRADVAPRQFQQTNDQSNLGLLGSLDRLQQANWMSFAASDVDRWKTKVGILVSS